MEAEPVMCFVLGPYAELGDGPLRGMPGRSKDIYRLASISVARGAKIAQLLNENAVLISAAQC
jgi:hypothetical protein